MGNSQTKESRSTAPLNRRGHRSSDASSRPYQGSRSARGSRPDLSILGIGSSHDRDVATLEHRRETKQEREARRLEKERVARLKERERSMKEEHVDGGYLVTQGVYVGTEDYNKVVVRQLMIERRLAPFWRGLNDFSESWAEHQLMAAARGMPIPPPDEIPPELEYKLPRIADKSPVDATNIQHLTVPITSRSQCFTVLQPPQSLPSASPIASGTSTSPLFRTRAKTLAALTTSSKHNSQTDLTPRELQLPKDPFVNGQPIEVNLYKDASECPICFLYYPPYLNRTRCCDQPICSECFVQIKRPDPHPPEHGEPEPNAPPAEREQTESTESQLVSEPSACPFCVQPEFGVTYASPSFRRGLTYAADPSARLSPNFTSPVSSTSSLSSATAAVPGRRRATSLSTTDPTVVTTDRIRPDWATKLSNARAHAARRSAAATALHTAAYLINPSASGNDSRGFGIGRRGMRRATAGEGSGGRTASPALNALAFLTERTATSTDRASSRAAGQDADSASAEEGSSNSAAARSSSRRNRFDDLEEMMMMEAIRLSLASEDERLRREEKEARKDAKKREKEKEKEAKKADKAARKSGLYSNNASASALDILGDSSLAKVASSSSSVMGEDAVGEEIAAGSKGKGVDRALPSTTGEMKPPSLLDPTIPTVQSADQSEPSRPSHLRHVSSASSSFSSIMETSPDDRKGGHTPGDDNNTSLEPLFNFRSLAAVIGDEEKADECAEHVEDSSNKLQTEGSCSSAAPSVHQPLTDANPDTTTPIVESHMESDGGSGVLPKELETRSVEITSSATHPEATS
ncbi:hypothetical protein N7457_003986 [Penicillium paradoxum]|uniref:uncharacterized protein n=1 Tax=Penicillium paradoxum TaxID=176176 RepID=UPI0025474267|nr:uncharacterized protein N7457_003986 [Penicillium paradoxum]KAJ5782212.1 hypothetical protein N7457_003986 [Penicillium paradoxum]